MALCDTMGLQSAKELREATRMEWECRIPEADLATLATLGSLLPALERLTLTDSQGSAGVGGRLFALSHGPHVTAAENAN